MKRKREGTIVLTRLAAFRRILDVSLLRDIVYSYTSRLFEREKSNSSIGMADFDAIYEEEEENEQNLEEHYVTTVPDPIIIRGAGNMTV